MCEPISIALITTAISTTLAVESQKAQAKGVSRAGNYRAAVAETRAKHARQVGLAEASQSRIRSAIGISRQRAALSASGQDLGSGSALSILSSSEASGDLNSRAILAGAAAQAYGLEGTAANARFDASVARSNLGLGIAATALGAASSVASTWFNARTPGSLTTQTQSTGTRYDPNFRPGFTSGPLFRGRSGARFGGRP